MAYGSCLFNELKFFSENSDQLFCEKLYPDPPSLFILCLC